MWLSNFAGNFPLIPNVTATIVGVKIKRKTSPFEFGKLGVITWDISYTIVERTKLTILYWVDSNNTRTEIARSIDGTHKTSPFRGIGTLTIGPDKILVVLDNLNYDTDLKMVCRAVSRLTGIADENEVNIRNVKGILPNCFD